MRAATSAEGVVNLIHENSPHPQSGHDVGAKVVAIGNGISIDDPLAPNGPVLKRVLIACHCVGSRESSGKQTTADKTPPHYTPTHASTPPDETLE